MSRVSNIVETYLEDEGTFRRGQTLIDVPVRSDEIEALGSIQAALRRGVAQRGIVIEVNPSSNLLIGDLRDLRNHPILRLHPPVTDNDSPPSVPIALGSDDPVTFSSQLLKEYVLLHQQPAPQGIRSRWCRSGWRWCAAPAWMRASARRGAPARRRR